MFLEFLKQPKQKISKKRKKACFDNKPDYITVGGPGETRTPVYNTSHNTFYTLILFVNFISPKGIDNPKTNYTLLYSSIHLRVADG